MSTHTPGPLHYDTTDEICREPNGTPHLLGYDDLDIAVYSGKEDEEHGQQVARQIRDSWNNTYAKGINPSAVPALVEALEALVDETEHCASIVGDPMYAAIKRDYRSKLAELNAAARAALADATKEG